MGMTIVNVILALPKIIGAIKALIAFANEMQERKRVSDLEKLKEEIKNAKSEDDFRNAASKL